MQLTYPHPIKLGRPLTEQELETNFGTFKAMMSNVLTRRGLFAIASQYTNLFDGMADDMPGLVHFKDGKEPIVVQYTGLRNSPAASGNHHNYKGGLIIHMLQMWEAWDMIRSNYMELSNPDLCMTDDVILRAILHHDLHKANATFCYGYETKDLGKIVYGMNPHTHLLSSDAQTLFLLNHYKVEVPAVLFHIHSLAEGGWSKNPPNDCTVTAKLCYLLDEFSGNVLERVLSRQVFDFRGIFKQEEMDNFFVPGGVTLPTRSE
jgi:hypothetical protein